MTVWQLLCALLRHALRGQGRHQVYVIPDGLPDVVQHELDDRDLTIVKTYTPHQRRDRFVVAIARPQPPVPYCAHEGGAD